MACDNRSSAVLAAVLATILSLTAFQARAGSRAVFVGLNTFDTKRNLRKPHFDANDLHEVSDAAGVVAKDRAEAITGRATRQSILDSIRKQAQATQAGDLLIISYAGHGTDDGRIYASDVTIRPSDIAQAVAGSGCDRILFINDSCSSEAFRLRVPGKKLTRIYGARKGRKAWYSNTPRPNAAHLNGVASKYVIMGLKNGGADLNNDGRITSHELGAYLETGVVACEESVPDRPWSKSFNRYAPSGYRAAVAGRTSGLLGAGYSGDDFVIAQKQPGQTWAPKAFMPYVVGRSRADAGALLTRLGRPPRFESYVIRPGRAISAAFKGQVGKQTPDRGEPLTTTAVPVLYMLPNSIISAPALVGLTPEVAKKAISTLGLMPYPKGVPPGPGVVVAGQRPAPGELILSGSYVRIVLSASQDVLVPKLRGETPDDARRILKTSGLAIIVAKKSPLDYPNLSRLEKEPRQEKYPPFVWGDHVWTCSPYEGRTVKVGSTVTVYTPPPPVNMPAIEWTSEAFARQALTAVGLKFEVVPPFNQEKDDARGVIHIDHVTPCFRGDTVRVIMEYPEVPSIIGKSATDAQAICQKAKLKFVAKRAAAPGQPPDVAFRQTPAATTRAHQQDVVTGYFPDATVTTVHPLQVDGKAVTASDLWGVFPASQELQAVNEQLRSDSRAPDGNGNPGFDRRWTGGSQSRSLSITLTVWPDRASALADVTAYGAAGVQAIAIGDTG
ncbi:MAG: PASTA domain-containing protein, partial [Verrucomicrobia bacterium]|nr:PASTA domain-containing protein [Verrucomicrobiota bacterium]